MDSNIVYFGSFSPTHVGHLTSIAKTLLWESNVKIDIIITPHNPHKKLGNLLPIGLRKEIFEISIEEYFTLSKNRVNINPIEEKMDMPNYTYLTLRELTKQYGEKPILMLGTDVINEIPNWKNYEEIIEYPIIALVRKGDEEYFDPNLKIVNDIIIDIDISSTVIRNLMSSYETRNLIVEENLMTEGAFKLLNRYYELNSLY